MTNHAQFTRTRRLIVNVLIGAVWLFLLVDAWLQGQEMPTLISEVIEAVSTELTLPSPALMGAAALLVSLGTAALAFWQRHNIMEDMPLLASGCNRFLGTGSYRYITHRLHPLAASVLTSLLLAFATWLHVTPATQSAWTALVSWGFAAFAICMIGAHLLSRRFPPVLY